MGGPLVVVSLEDEVSALAVVDDATVGGVDGGGERNDELELDEEGAGAGDESRGFDFDGGTGGVAGLPPLPEEEEAVASLLRTGSGCVTREGL